MAQTGERSYFEKLKDPRWQRRRLEIFRRDDFTCQHCGEQEKTLHVHHLVYHYSLDPWDYDGEDLKTLCEACHADEKGLSAAKTRLITSLMRAGFTTAALEDLSDELEAGGALALNRFMLNKERLGLTLLGTLEVPDGA